MTTRSIFSTPLYHEQNVVDAETAAAIRAYVLYHYARYGSDKADEDLFNSPEAADLCPQLLSVQSKFNIAFHTLLDQVGRGDRSFDLVSCKYNVMRRGEMRAIHMHQGIDAFGILYLSEGPKSAGGELVLHDPKFTDSIFTPSSMSLIEPEIGAIVAVPAYIWHSVNPYYGSEERVALVVNCEIRCDD